MCMPMQDITFLWQNLLFPTYDIADDNNDDDVHDG